MEEYEEIVSKMNTTDLFRLARALNVPMTQRFMRKSLLIRMLQERLRELPTEEPPALRDPAIVIAGMSKRFGPNVAVRRLNLVVHPGEIVGLVGPNGAGKTTTLRIIAGIIRPTRGRVIVNGHDITRHGIEAKRVIGYVPERPSCYENLKVREYLTFVAKIYGVPTHEAVLRIAEYADMLQLTPFLDAYVGTLSKGNLQRTLLAGVFVRPPPYVIVFDEPIYGLDPRGAWSLKKHLKKLRDQGSAILISTHILEVAEGLCDRFIIMHEGDVVGQGTLEELKAQCPNARNLEEMFLDLTGGIPAE
ncbi:MAG: ABC transporter ATP-binding protein [Candidatus Thorarchaeota archaeon]